MTPVTGYLLGRGYGKRLSTRQTDHGGPCHRRSTDGLRALTRAG